MEVITLPSLLVPEDLSETPDNYISFDRWVPPPQNESTGASIRCDVIKIESNMASQAAMNSRAPHYTGGMSGHVPAHLGEPKLFIPVNDLPKTLSQHDIVAMLENEELNDNFRMNVVLDDPDPHIGSLPLKDLNPFFRPRDTECDPFSVDVEDNNFVAMSYYWGPEAPVKMIYANGMELPARLNLEAGLRQFRDMEYFKAGGKIWIDALCINQNDVQEKAVQVQMMGSIYRLAGNVIVWLGTADDDSDRCIQSLESLSTWHRTEYIELCDKSDPLTANCWREVAQVKLRASVKRFCKPLRKEYDKLDTVEEDTRLYKFFDRPYWRRLWIIQELAMGRAGMPIVCGSRLTQWRYIRDAAFLHASFIDLLTETLPSSCIQTRTVMKNELSIYHVAQIAQLEVHGHRKVIPKVDKTWLPVSSTHGYGHGPLQGSSLRRAIILASQCNSSWAHDRIYGLLSVPGLPDLGISVDYEKKVSTVFTEFATACIQKCQSLDFLSLVDGGGLSKTDSEGKLQEYEYMPSWVPDFASKYSRRMGVIEGEWYASGNQQDFFWHKGTAYGYTPFVSPFVVGNELVCHGFVAEIVDGMGAISKIDLEIGKIESSGTSFKTGVVQPTKQKVDKYDNSNSMPSDPNWPHWELERIGKWLGEQKEKMTRINRAYEKSLCPMLYWVLVGGADIAGNKAPGSFKCLYEAFPDEEPPRQSTYSRGWHFLNSSASLLINSKPLSSYFNPWKLGNPGEYGNPRWNFGPDIETGAARQAMEGRTKNRRIIITESGLLGLAPIGTQPGDAIMVIIGHGKPVVARKWQYENKVDEPEGALPLWHLIGEVFVDGMMEWEMMERDIYSGRKKVGRIAFA